MQLNERIRELRQAKKLSQGDIEKRTGLFRCYTSRVENGYTVPNLETLEKYAPERWRSRSTNSSMTAHLPPGA